MTASRTNAKFGALHAFYAQPKQALGNADNLRQHACKWAFRAYQSGIAENSIRAEKSKGTPRHFPYRGRRKESKYPEEFPQKSEGTFSTPLNAL